MNWDIDPATRRAALEHPLRCLDGEPACQFAGRPFRPQKWSHLVQNDAQWPAGPVKSSPSQIIKLFAEEDYLQALAMVVSWGTMWRHPDAIWGDRSLHMIEAALRKCTHSITRTESIRDAWHTLTDGDTGLGWSPVITSKTLHFLSRGLGFEQDPPVAIDNKVILNRVWPAFRDSIPVQERPAGWCGAGYDSYSRYMTAMLAWASKNGWTTTQVEATLFARCR